jgi:hypothetical protein
MSTCASCIRSGVSCAARSLPTPLGETHFHRTDDLIFEYARHEGNRAITDNLTSARHHDAQMKVAEQH